MSEMLLPGITFVILKLFMKVFDMRYNLWQNKAKQQAAKETNSSVTLLRSPAF